MQNGKELLKASASKGNSPGKYFIFKKTEQSERVVGSSY